MIINVNSLTIGFKGMLRKEFNDLNYLLNENLWGPFKDQLKINIIVSYLLIYLINMNT